MNLDFLIRHIDTFLGIISCFFAVFSIVFSVYLWSLEKAQEDKINFVLKKREYIFSINTTIKRLTDGTNIDGFVDAIREINYILLEISCYRFWNIMDFRNNPVENIKQLYQNLKITQSKLIRSQEDDKLSLFSIDNLSADEINKMIDRYIPEFYKIINIIEGIE